MIHSKRINKTLPAIIGMAAVITFIVGTPANARERPIIQETPTFSEWVCEHKPSNIIRGTLKGLASTGAVIAAPGTALKATKFYIFRHAVTWKIMLGSKLAGTSAAGTIGIIKGTAGVIGTTSAFFISPVMIKGSIVVVVVTTTAAITYETYCYFTEDGDEETPE